VRKTDLIKVFLQAATYYSQLITHKKQMADDKNQNQNQLNIELSEEIADGIYSNLAIITHSNSEFVFDFIKVMPGMPKARVKSRILMTPQHAKRLMQALKDNLSKFEAIHGTIKVEGGPVLPMNFGGPTAQA
jgi:hypothetical protein